MDKNKLIKIIHVARRELKMDEETYRQFLRTHTKKDSLKLMQVWELEILIKAFKKLGFKVKSTVKNSEKTPQDWKIIRLWKELAKAEIVADESEAALNHYIKRQTGIERLEWLNHKQCSNVIESLKKWQQRSINHVD